MDELVTTALRASAATAPDAMRVSVAVEASAPTVAAALAAVAEGARRVGEAARRHTAEDRNASQGFRVHTSHDHEGRPDGYVASHALRLLCDLAAAGPLVTDLGDSVGDGLRVHDVRPVVTDPAPLLARARELAFEDARARAHQLAALAGRSLGRVLQVVEGDHLDAGPVVEVAFARASVDFEPGSHEVGASVTVRWALEG